MKEKPFSPSSTESRVDELAKAVVMSADLTKMLLQELSKVKEEEDSRGIKYRNDRVNDAISSVSEMTCGLAAVCKYLTGCEPEESDDHNDPECESHDDETGDLMADSGMIDMLYGASKYCVSRDNLKPEFIGVSPDGNPVYRFTFSCHGVPGWQISESFEMPLTRDMHETVECFDTAIECLMARLDTKKEPESCRGCPHCGGSAHAKCTPKNGSKPYKVKIEDAPSPSSPEESQPLFLLDKIDAQGLRRLLAKHAAHKPGNVSFQNRDKKHGVMVYKVWVNQTPVILRVKRHGDRPELVVARFDKAAGNLKSLSGK